MSKPKMSPNNLKFSASVPNSVANTMYCKYGLGSSLGWTFDNWNPVPSVPAVDFIPLMIDYLINNVSISVF